MGRRDRDFLDLRESRTVQSQRMSGRRVLSGALLAMGIWLASSAGQAAQKVTSAAKEPVRIVFVARVQNVYDPGESLQEAIRVGDLMRGTMTYDSTTRASIPRPGVGRYEFRQAPFGILIEAGQYVFQTDPDHVDVSIELSNDEGVPPRDSFLLTSRNNLPLSNGAAVSRIFWQLVDDTAKALAGTRLSADAPDLDTWRSEFGLTLEGQATVEFIIRAHVIEAALCTPEIRCPSPR
jgi:hypothetical protein